MLAQRNSQHLFHRLKNLGILSPLGASYFIGGSDVERLMKHLGKAER